MWEGSAWASKSSEQMQKGSALLVGMWFWGAGGWWFWGEDGGGLGFFC